MNDARSVNTYWYVVEALVGTFDLTSSNTGTITAETVGGTSLTIVGDNSIRDNETKTITYNIPIPYKSLGHYCNCAC